MNILEQIVAQKKKEVEASKKKVSETKLTSYPYFLTKSPSLKENLLNNPNFPVIAEFKRHSPSRGHIHPNAGVADIVPAYEKAGVSGVSILTDTTFFGGTINDLTTARNLVKTPILRKDFIIDPYQIIESKAIGAGAILLIASILTKTEARILAELAHKLELEVLMELHSPEEAELLNDSVDMVGINNRNLKTFEVNLNHAAGLITMLPPDMLPVAESGIHSAGDLLYLKEAGFKGFLIGEYFMKHENPGQACRELKMEITENR